jgi:hypothetical protein
MELAVAIALIERNILQGLRHRDYERVRKLAKKYKRLLTGEEPEKLLLQFVQREDAAMFAQRCAITQLITPALCASLRKPFQKVSRNNKVVKRIDIKDATRKKVVEQMLDMFYGNSPDTNGLEQWLQTRFEELTFADPNAWIVTEFDNFDNTRTFPQPRPFEVSAAEAVNFEIINEVVSWLLVQQEVDVPRLAKTTSIVSFAAMDEAARSKNVKVDVGSKYTLYTDTVALVYTQVDKDYITAVGIPEGAELVTLDEKKKLYFLKQEFNPDFGQVPAMRIGYMRDDWTDGRTFVSPIHAAMPYLMKSVKAVSELDLSMTLHAFPQKIQYVQRCKGISKEFPCNGGKKLDGADCTACKGKGYVIHTSAQDAIILPMPDNKEDMLDLSQIVQYVTPPESLIKFQADFIDTFQTKCHEAVFNSQVFVANTVVKTATEKDMDMENAYDTLHPYSKAVSLMYKFIARMAMVLADVEDANASVTHAFPSDFKLKTLTALVNELKIMNDSGAPSFVKDATNDDMAEIMYAGDPMAFIKHKVKKTFFPFPGKSTDEIALLLDSSYVTQFNKILYANFENVFAELERENKAFYLMDFNEQWKLLGDKINLIITELKQAGADRFNPNTDTGGKDSTDNEDKEDI